MDIERIREIKISKLLGRLESGRKYAISCPFGHRDKTPSCYIFPDNSFHCFSCGKHGFNAIDFVMAMGYSFKEAKEELERYL